MIAAARRFLLRRHREARSFAWLDDLARDLRYAARTLALHSGIHASRRS